MIFNRWLSIGGNTFNLTSYLEQNCLILGNGCQILNDSNTFHRYYSKNIIGKQVKQHYNITESIIEKRRYDI